MQNFYIGTAGWNIPSEARSSFAQTGSHLERYALTLPAVEINSSFYRHHLATTYRRWADSTPAHFRFSVKLAKAFTHEARLLPSGDAVRSCLDSIRELGKKWGALLVPLPPSLYFEKTKCENFLGFLSEHCPAPIVWEPRHLSWTHPSALRLLENFGVCKVIADPDTCPAPLQPNDGRMRYYRLHGSPMLYRSRYRAPFIAKIARAIKAAPAPNHWCIFDNTAFGFATENAAELLALMQDRRPEERIVS